VSLFVILCPLSICLGRTVSSRDNARFRKKERKQSIVIVLVSKIHDTGHISLDGQERSIPHRNNPTTHNPFSQETRLYNNTATKMSSNSNMTSLVQILGINPSRNETEKAVLTVMMASLGNPHFDDNKPPSAHSEETRTHLSNLHTKLTAKAEIITKVQDELVLVKDATKKWYRTINSRVARNSRNPWLPRAANSTKRPPGATSHIRRLKKSWKNTWSMMGAIEERLLVKCKLNRPEFQRLLLDDEALAGFQADMKVLREMQMELSREYLRVLEVDRICSED